MAYNSKITNKYQFEFPTLSHPIHAYKIWEID